MAFVKLSIPRTSQPQDACEVDWSNPITSGLVRALLPQGVEMLDCVTGTYATRNVSTYTREITFQGVGRRTNSLLLNSSASVTRATETSTSLSLVWSGVVHEIGGTTFPFWRSGQTFVAASAVASPRWYVRSAGTNFASISKTINLGTPSSYVLSQQGTAFNFYVSGGKAASGTTMTSALGTSHGIDCNVGTAQSNDFSTDILLIYNRGLSESEALSLSINPWQIFEPEEQWIWVDDAVGGTTNATILQTDGADTAATSAANWRTGQVSVADGADVHTVVASASSITLASVGATDGSDAQAVTAANWRTGQTSVIDGADIQALAATAGSLTTAAVAQTDGADSQAVTSAIWTTAQVICTDGKDLTAIAASANSITLASVATADGPDTQAVTGAIVGVTSATIAQVDASDQHAIASIVTTGAVIYGTDGADSAVTAAANWATAMLAAVDGKDTTSVLGSMAGSAVYPLPAQVLLGVTYGPTGADYVGTATGGSGTVFVHAITLQIEPQPTLQVNNSPITVHF